MSVSARLLGVSSYHRGRRSAPVGFTASVPPTALVEVRPGSVRPWVAVDVSDLVNELVQELARICDTDNSRRWLLTLEPTGKVLVAETVLREALMAALVDAVVVAGIGGEIRVGSRIEGLRCIIEITGSPGGQGHRLADVAARDHGGRAAMLPLLDGTSELRIDIPHRLVPAVG
jgi:hypothetical protein